MKYLELFENFKYIDDICYKYGIGNYIINQDGSIDVNGDVYLENKTLSVLPLKFNRVGGYFFCYDNKLTTLEGSPKEVGYHFLCGHNQLTSLEGGPQKTGGSFNCSNNKLTTLIGGPKSVGFNYFCGGNQLTDVHGFPNYLIDGGLYISNNPVSEIISVIGPKYKDRVKFIFWLNEYDVIRDGNKIVEMRLEEAYYMTMKKELPMGKREFEYYTLI